MRIHLCLLLCVVTNVAAAQEYIPNFYYRFNEDNLDFSINCQYIPDNDGRKYWRAINPLENSTVIYKVTLPDSAIWAFAYLDSEFKIQTENDFIDLRYSSDLYSHWAQLDYGSYSANYRGFVHRVHIGKELFLWAEFRGGNIKAFGPSTSVLALIIPEPQTAALVMGMCVALSCLRIRKWRN